MNVFKKFLYYNIVINSQYICKLNKKYKNNFTNKIDSLITAISMLDYEMILQPKIPLLSGGYDDLGMIIRKDDADCYLIIFNRSKYLRLLTSISFYKVIGGYAVFREDCKIIDKQKVCKQNNDFSIFNKILETL